MIFRAILILIVVFVVYAIYKFLFRKGGFGRCEKCEGMGYWIATRGEKTTCDNCGGSGKVKW